MKNKEQYEKHIKDGATIKQIILDDHVPVVASCKKLFKSVFSRNPKELMILRDIKAENADSTAETPSRIDAYVGGFAALIKLMDLANDKTLVDKLEAEGIKVDITTRLTNPSILPSDIDASNWSKAFGNAQKPTDLSSMLSMLLEQCCKQKDEIDKMSDEIRLNHAEIVEQECEIKKPHYIRAVNLKVKSQKVSLDKDMEKAKKDIKSQEESLEIFQEFKSNDVL